MLPKSNKWVRLRRWLFWFLIARLLSISLCNFLLFSQPHSYWAIYSPQQVQLCMAAMPNLMSSNRKDVLFFGSTCMIRLLEQCTGYIHVVPSLTAWETYFSWILWWCLISWPWKVLWLFCPWWFESETQKIEVLQVDIVKCLPKKVFIFLPYKQLLLEVWLRSA